MSAPITANNAFNFMTIKFIVDLSCNRYLQCKDVWMGWFGGCVTLNYLFEGFSRFLWQFLSLQPGAVYDRVKKGSKTIELDGDRTSRPPHLDVIFMTAVFVLVSLPHFGHLTFN